MSETKQSEEHSVGPADAPITVVEYADFHCPFARRAVPIVKEIQGRWEGQVRFVFRHFPLVDLHPKAHAAALAAEAAGQQGAFWEMFEVLFAEQRGPHATDFARHAERLGLDVAKFQEAMASDAVRQRVERDLQEGRGRGVHSTPTFLVNEALFDGSAQDLPELVAQTAARRA